jgi:hypothetical protein
MTKNTLLELVKKSGVDETVDWILIVDSARVVVRITTAATDGL